MDRQDKKDKKDNLSNRKIQAVENLSYTAVHTVACAFNDILVSSAVSNFTSKYLDRRFSTGCGDGGWRHWLTAEAISDAGAIAPTVALAYYAPNFMGKLQKFIEPVFGKMFEKSIARAVRKEAAIYGVEDEAAINQRVAEKKQEEMAQLPLAFVWTAIAFVGNVAIQYGQGAKHAHHHHEHVQDATPLWNIALSKMAGSGVAFALAVGARATAPTAMRTYDHFTNEKISLPVTKKLGKWLGVDEKAIDSAIRKHHDRRVDTWAERMKKEQSETAGRIQMGG